MPNKDEAAQFMQILFYEHNFDSHRGYCSNRMSDSGMTLLKKLYIMIKQYNSYIKIMDPIVKHYSAVEFDSIPEYVIKLRYLII